MPDGGFRVEKDCDFYIRLLLETYVDANPAVVECLRTSRSYACRMAEEALTALEDAVFRASVEGCLSKETARDLYDEIALTREAVSKARRGG